MSEVEEIIRKRVSELKKRKQRVDLLKPFITDFDPKDVSYFERVPLEIAKELMTGYPNVNPEDRQNYSPTMKRMIEIVEKYGGTLDGYIVHVESGRWDARITFDAFTIRCSYKVAFELVNRLKPDDARKMKEGFYFWWD